jgi:hypothetical protein
MTIGAVDTLDGVLSALGAADHEVHKDGTVGFRVGDVSGLASVRGHHPYVVSASFFLPMDAELEEVDDWVRSTAQPVWDGEVRVQETDAGREVRLSVELPLDHQTLTRADLLNRRLAMLQEAWLYRSVGVDDMLLTLAREGVPCPPLAGMEGSIRKYRDWQWGSRPFDAFEHYMFEVPAVVESVMVDKPLFQLSHDGHGANSYGLNLVISSGPVAAFVQHPFGGIYMDDVSVRVDIAGTYAKLFTLFVNLSAQPGPPRWMLLQSALRGSSGVMDLTMVRGGSAWQDSIEPASWNSNYASARDEAGLFRLAASKFPNADLGDLR